MIVTSSKTAQNPDGLADVGQVGEQLDPAARPVRRRFATEYRAHLVDEYEAAPHDQKGSVALRRHLPLQLSVASDFSGEICPCAASDHRNILSKDACGVRFVLNATVPYPIEWRCARSTTSLAHSVAVPASRMDSSSRSKKVRVPPPPAPRVHADAPLAWLVRLRA